MIPSLIAAALLLTTFVSSSPISRLHYRATAINPLISIDFPDPSIVQDSDGTWYAFATNGNNHNIQAASASSPSGPWSVLDSANSLPTPGDWSNGQNVWAPEIRKIGSQYVLYYSATDAVQTAQHCVGAATSDTILGAYSAAATPIACNLIAGGAIDPSGFTDEDGTHYVVYKADGNSVGHGGSCGNTAAPIVPIPLMLQQLAADGVTPVNGPIELLDRGDADGPLIEAPNMILINGVYFLFFSSNCYMTTLYDVSYATATSVKGPFTKSSAPILVTNKPYEVTAPEGATVTTDGENIVFHANCPAGRCMFERAITISGTQVTMS